MIRAGGPALAALERSGQGRIVSVHARAANVLLADGSLIGLVPADRPIHPWALGVPFDPGELGLDAAVRVLAGELTAGPHRVDLARARAVCLELVARPGAVSSGLGPLLRRLPVPRPDASPFDPVMDGAVDALVTRRDMGRLAGLIGVGEGLTPAGDDLIVGVLAGLDLVAVARPGSAALRHDLARRVMPSLAGATTRLSAQLVRSAVDGLYSEPILELLAALAGSHPTAAELRRPAASLAAVGHTSGVRTLEGIAAALTLSDEDAVRPGATPGPAPLI